MCVILYYCLPRTDTQFIFLKNDESFIYRLQKYRHTYMHQYTVIPLFAYPILLSEGVVTRWGGQPACSASAAGG